MYRVFISLFMLCGILCPSALYSQGAQPGDIIIVDNDDEKIWVYHSETGITDVLASETVGSGPFLGGGMRDGALSPNGDLYVNAFFGILVSVNITTGDRIEISGPNRGIGLTQGGFPPPAASSLGIAVSQDGTIYIISPQGYSSGPGLIKVNPVTGDREYVAVFNGDVYEVVYGQSLSIMPDDIILFTKYNDPQVFAIDPLIKIPFVLSGDGIGQGPVPPSGPSANIVHADQRGNIYLSTQGDSTTSGRIFKIDYLTGDRTILSDDIMGMGPLFPLPPTSMDTDKIGNLIVGISASVYHVNIASGDRIPIINYPPKVINLATGIAVVPFPPPEATVDMNPDTINLRGQGSVLFAYITLSAGYSAADIDTSTVVITAVDGSLVSQPLHIDASFSPLVGDRDQDGLIDLTVRFDRQELISYLSEGQRLLTIEGALTSGESFSGTDTIRVIDRGR